MNKTNKTMQDVKAELRHKFEKYDSGIDQNLSDDFSFEPDFTFITLMSIIRPYLAVNDQRALLIQLREEIIEAKKHHPPYLQADDYERGILVAYDYVLRHIKAIEEAR